MFEIRHSRFEIKVDRSRYNAGKRGERVNGHANREVGNADWRKGMVLEKWITHDREEAGFVTLLVLLLMVTLAASGLQIYVKASTADRIARREAQSRQAVYFAEGGIEWAKGQLLIDPGWTGGSIPVGGGHVQVTVNSSGSGYQVTASAQAGLAVRKVQVFLVNNSGYWTVSGYHEVHS